uniref:F-box domain-containing protein n=1 Tax=Caenorhabditis tropicalis TaxID=1561998 RepID=A0A1I7TH81_9PELO
MAAFHLLQLPLVAMDYVLSMMNPYEWINLSMVSSRSKITVRNYSKINKPQYQIHLEFIRNPHIFLNGENESWGFGWGTDESRAGYEHETIVKHDTHKINNYSKNPMEEMMKWYDYIKGVLVCQIELVDLDLSLYPAQNKVFTDWLRSQQASIDSLEIRDSGEGFDEDMKYIIENITVIDELWLSTTDYKAGFQMEIPIVTRSVTVNDSRFIDFEQLLRLKNRKISLDESILTSREINQFVKSWMARESHLDLETIDINISGPEAIDNIIDMPCEIIDDPKLVFEIVHEFDFPDVDTWYDIKRIDGKVATVAVGLYYDEQRFFMIIR